MELSLINAGRGAGKTYNLVKWAKESPNRYVVGTTATRDAMLFANLKPQFVYINDVKNGHFAGRQNIEVAFDNFEFLIYDLLHGDFRLSGAKSVILATNIAVSEYAPEVKYIPVTGAYADAILGKYGDMFKTVENTVEGLLAPLLGVVTPQETEKKPEPATETEKKPDSEFVAAGGWSVPKGQAYDPLDLCAESDTKQIPADQLRLGDKLPQGKVVSVSFEDSTHDHVVVKVKSAGFTGTLRIRREQKVTVDK